MSNDKLKKLDITLTVLPVSGTYSSGSATVARSVLDLFKGTLQPITDYSKWLDLGLWKIYQAVCLGVGIEPIKVGGSSLTTPEQIERAITDQAILQRWQRMYTKAKHALQKGELAVIDPINGTRLPLHFQVDPKVFAEWATREGFTLPEQIAQLVTPKGGDKRGRGAPPKNADVLKLVGRYAENFYANPENSGTSIANMIRSRPFIAEVFPTKEYIDPSMTKNERTYTKVYGTNQRQVSEAASPHWNLRARK